MSVERAGSFIFMHVVVPEPLHTSGRHALGPAYAPSWPIAGRQNHRNGGRQGKPRLVPDQIDPARRKDD